MRLRILGSGAGGGVPQWNCGCGNCTLARSGNGAVLPRTQDSVAVSAAGVDWFLLNASPDIHRQIEAFAALQPRGARDSPIAGIVLTNGDLDHCLGLLLLRESQPLHVYATDAVWSSLVERNVVFRTLQRSAGQLTHHPLRIGQEELLGGGPLSITPLAVPGNVPLHLAGLVPPTAEDNIAVVLRDRDSGATLLYAPAALDLDVLQPVIDEVGCVLIDGTFFSSDELIRAGGGFRTAEQMAHTPIGGTTGSLRRLAWRAPRRTFYTHINNTNPILRAGSSEQAAVEAAGVTIAEDAVEVEV